MPLPGLIDTSGFLTSQRPENWREGLLLLDPNGIAPLTALTSLMPKRRTDDPKFHWFEKKLPNQRFELNADVAAADTSLTVIHTASDPNSGARQLKAGHLLRAEETGEIMLVTAAPASETSIPVLRGFAGTSAQAIDHDAAGVNPNLHVIGNVHEEGSDAPDGIGYAPREFDNYTQIFRDTLELTRTAMRTRLRTPAAATEARREASQLHKLHLEKALWFGRKASTTINGKPARTTDGVISFIENNSPAANVVDQAGAAMDMETFEDWLEKVFRFGSQEKMGFCGNRAMLTLQRLVRKNANYEFVQGEKEFGMNVRKFITPFGMLSLKTHPLFNQLISGATGGTDWYTIDSWIVVLDQANFMYRFVDDTMFERDLQDNGLDGMKSGWLTECGLEVHFPESHGILKGFAQAAADS